MAKGKKTGGRKRGTLNHVTVERKAKLNRFMGVLGKRASQMRRNSSLADDRCSR